MQTLKERLQEVNSLVESLQNQQKVLKEAVTEIEKKVADVDKELGPANTEIEAARVALNALVEKYSQPAHSDECKIVERVCRDYGQGLNDARSKISGLQATIKTDTETLETAQDTLTSAEEDFKAAKTKLTNLAANIKTSAQRVKSLVTKAQSDSVAGKDDEALIDIGELQDAWKRLKRMVEDDYLGDLEEKLEAAQQKYIEAADKVQVINERLLINNDHLVAAKKELEDLENVQKMHGDLKEGVLNWPGSPPSEGQGVLLNLTSGKLLMPDLPEEPPKASLNEKEDAGDDIDDADDDTGYDDTDKMEAD